MGRSPTAIALVLAALVPVSGCHPMTPGNSSASSGQQASRASRANSAHESAAPRAARANANARDKAGGWRALDAAARAEVNAFAEDYARYLARAKTERQAIAGLVEIFAASGAEEIAIDDAVEAAPAEHGRYYLRSVHGDAAAFIRVGRMPLDQGARIIIASVDAPHIVLEQRPVKESHAGVTVLDTRLYGQLDLPSWLSRPLALHLFMARPGAADGALELAIGERADDPVLVIPDLLPHLSHRVQRQQVVDSPKRMNAIAARSSQALLTALAAHGVDERALAQSEASLVPAGPPVFVGVDRSLLAGHGGSSRAMAYAAVRALIDQEDGGDGSRPERSSVVIVLRSVDSTKGSNSALGFVEVAFARAIEALAPAESPPDVLDTRRAYALSTAWLAVHRSGALGQGLILAPLADDATPTATRRAIEAMERAGAPYQFMQRGGWGFARILATLDLDTVEVGLPVHGRGAPLELLSTLDLHHARRAAHAWLAGW